MKKIAVLASGEGTNAERIIRYFKEKRTAEVALVISSRPSAGVIERARRLGVVCKTVVPSEFRSGEALRLLPEVEIDFVVLAGFLSRIPETSILLFCRSSEGMECTACTCMKRCLRLERRRAALRFSISMRSMMKATMCFRQHVLCFRKTLLSRWLPGCMNWNTGTIRR